jgi:Xaa-Pro dipeptidase
MNALPFSLKEFENRLANIKQQMLVRGLDALILTRPQNIYYVSGYRAALIASWTSQIHPLVVPAKGEPRIMTRALERETVKTQWTKDPWLYMDHDDPFKVLHDIIQENRATAGKIGVEEGFMTVRQLKKIMQYCSEADFVDATGLVESVRTSPSRAESECVRKAAKIADVGFQTAIEHCREGAHPYEIVAEIHNAMYKAGQTDFEASFVAVWSGPRGGMMHDTTTTGKISKGDMVTIEIHGNWNLYKAGAQGSIYVGDNPPASIVDTYEMISGMCREARDAIKPDVRAGDIFDAANRIYKSTRGADYYRRVGGSIGLTLFDVDLGKEKQDQLKPGLSLLVQPLVDDPALITCACTVMVTEKGWEELTKPLLQLYKV